MWYIYVAVVTSSTRISLLLNSILEFHLSYVSIFVKPLQSLIIVIPFSASHFALSYPYQLLFVDQRHCLKFLSNPVCLAIVPAFCKHLFYTLQLSIQVYRCCVERKGT
ncbi:hypothetical protein LINGRAHAP2_LOCUS14245 [Linum grandiflorum]